MTWNKAKLKEDLLIFNLVNHHLKNKKIKIRNDMFLIKNVFKEWDEGWYISVELKEISGCYSDQYIKIPFKNINSENKEILEIIEIINSLAKEENGTCCLNPPAKT